MGKQFFDQFSLLHTATGIVSYFWGLSFLVSLALHTVFEWVENTSTGVRFINETLAGIWPGGKPEPDAMINRVGDSIVFALGWYIAYKLDAYGVKHEWY